MPEQHERPGIMVKSEMDAHNLTPHIIAQKFHTVSEDYIEDVINERAGISDRLASALCIETGIAKSKWINIQKEYDTAAHEQKTKLPGYKSRQTAIEHLPDLNFDQIKILTAQRSEHTQYDPYCQYELTTESGLCKRLLAINGSSVKLPDIEEDLNNILKYGQLWDSQAKLMKGRPSQCHANSCELWYNNQEDTVIATGYALSPDGIWRQHSWLIWIKPRTNMIIETTVPRLAYFGFAMTKEMCRTFYYDNL